MSQERQARIAAVVRRHRPQQGLYTDGALQCGCGGKYISNEVWADHVAEVVVAADDSWDTLMEILQQLRATDRCHVIDRLMIAGIMRQLCDARIPLSEHVDLWPGNSFVKKSAHEAEHGQDCFVCSRGMSEPLARMFAADPYLALPDITHNGKYRFPRTGEEAEALIGNPHWAHLLPGMEADKQERS